MGVILNVKVIPHFKLPEKSLPLLAESSSDVDPESLNTNVVNTPMMFCIVRLCHNKVDNIHTLPIYMIHVPHPALLPYIQQHIHSLCHGLHELGLASHIWQQPHHGTSREPCQHDCY